MAPVIMTVAPRGFKADLIRKHLAATPNATGQEIADAVNADAKSQNIMVECAPVEIYPYKKKMGATTEGGETVRKTRTPKVEEAPREVTVSECVSAVDFCKTLGGMEMVAKQVKGMQDIKEKFGSIERFADILIQTGKFMGDKKVLKVFGVEG